MLLARAQASQVWPAINARGVPVGKADVERVGANQRQVLRSVYIAARMLHAIRLNAPLTDAVYPRAALRARANASQVFKIVLADVRIIPGDLHNAPPSVDHDLFRFV